MSAGWATLAASPEFCAVTALGAVIAVLFFYFTRNNTLEKEIDENVMKVLKGESLSKKENKPKQKPKNKKKETEANNHKQPEAAAVPVAEVAEEHDQTTSAPVTPPAPETNHTTKKRNKRSVEEPVVVEVQQKTEAAPTPSPSKSVDSTEDKQGKKKRKSKGKVVVPEQTKPKQPVRRVSVSELNNDKVLDRLADIQELEPEYLSFLATLFIDSGNRTVLAEESLAEAQKQLDRKNKELDIAHKELTAARGETTNLRAQTNAGLQANKTLTDTNKKLVDESNRLKHEVETFRAQVRSLDDKVKLATGHETAARDSVAEIQKLKDRINALEKEKTDAVTTLSKEIAETEDKLLSSTDRATALLQEKEILSARFEELTQQLSAQEESTQKNAENESLKEKLASAEKKAHEMEIALKATEKKNQDLEKSAGSERDELEKKLLEAMESYQAMQKLVEDLNVEIAEFEKVKKELAEREKDLKEVGALKKRIQELEAENVRLAEEGTYVKVEASTENAAPGEVDRLNERITFLEKKNDELRERNSNIVRQSMESSGSGADASTIVGFLNTALGPVVGKNINGSSSKDVKEWLDKSVVPHVNKQEKSAAAPAVDNNKKQPKADSREKELEKEVRELLSKLHDLQEKVTKSQ